MIARRNVPEGKLALVFLAVCVGAVAVAGWVFVFIRLWFWG